MQARVVHLPGMEDEPSSTFTNMATLFKKLDISVEGDEDTDQPQGKHDIACTHPQGIRPASGY